jgi:hypothetical protein
MDPKTYTVKSKGLAVLFKLGYDTSDLRVPMRVRNYQTHFFLKQTVNNKTGSTYYMGCGGCSDSLNIPEGKSHGGAIGVLHNYTLKSSRDRLATKQFDHLTTSMSKFLP